MAWGARALGFLPMVLLHRMKRLGLASVACGVPGRLRALPHVLGLGMHMLETGWVSHMCSTARGLFLVHACSAGFPYEDTTCRLVAAVVLLIVLDTGLLCSLLVTTGSLNYILLLVLHSPPFRLRLQ